MICKILSCSMILLPQVTQNTGNKTLSGACCVHITTNLVFVLYKVILLFSIAVLLYCFYLLKAQPHQTCLAWYSRSRGLKITALLWLGSALRELVCISGCDGCRQVAQNSFLAGLILLLFSCCLISISGPIPGSQSCCLPEEMLGLCGLWCLVLSI